MWEEIKYAQNKKKETMFFLDWMNQVVLQPKYLKQAEDQFLEIANDVKEVADYRVTPQSAPWHVEGQTVADGIIRMLATVYAIVDGATLLDTEEWARHKELRYEVIEIEETIREHAATFEVYALVHDIAKPVTLSFTAPSGSKGEKEGFSQHRHRVSREATEKEKQLYLKLLKAFHTSRTNLSTTELMAAFFDEYEIAAHYSNHAKIGAGNDFFDAREKVANAFRLSDRERTLITFMVKNHMDVFSFFSKATNQKKFELLTARAVKAGFDADDALDMLLAGTFLDSVAGSLAYRDGAFSVDMKSIFHWMYSEQQHAPHRRELRRESDKKREKERLMQALKKAQLAPEDVFELLNVEFGPKRGEVMNEIYMNVQNPSTKIDFGEHTTVIAPRIKEARQFFDAGAQS